MATVTVSVNKRSVSHSGKQKYNALSNLSITELVELQKKKIDSRMSARSLCELYSIDSSTVYDMKKDVEKLLLFFSNSGSKNQLCIRKMVKDRNDSELDQISVTFLIMFIFPMVAPLGL